MEEYQKIVNSRNKIFELINEVKKLVKQIEKEIENNLEKLNLSNEYCVRLIEENENLKMKLNNDNSKK